MFLIVFYNLQILPHDVENILESLLSAELKMNNLPYDNINDLIKGLQVCIANYISSAAYVTWFFLAGAY